MTISYKKSQQLICRQFMLTDLKPLVTTKFLFYNVGRKPDTQKIRIMKKPIVISCLLFITSLLSAQYGGFQTFKDTRVINMHSTEILKAGHLDVRIGHRFGDISGDRGGWPTFFGLENASDVLIGFEYGVSDKMMVGINRTKGSGELRQNINGLVKIKLMSQNVDASIPFSLAILATGSFSTMPAGGPGTLSEFQKMAHRASYHASFLLAKKISNRLSIQLNGAWTYRNLVQQSDKNDLVSAGVAARLQMTKALALLVDANFPFSDFRSKDNGFYNPLGFGLEWETGGGHIFQMNFTNSTGMSETDYIPYTQSRWGDGEFRLGFTISRLFTLS